MGANGNNNGWVIGPDAPGGVHYLETGDNALVVRGSPTVTSANFLLDGRALFYHDVITFGTTTLPTLQTTLVRATDTDGVVITTASGAIVCQSEESGNLKVPYDLVCNNTVTATALEAASVEASLVRARDANGIVIITSGGAIVCQS